MNVSTIVQDGLCTGCGTCVSACPNGSVSMTLSPKKGIYIPTVDSRSCEDCGDCVSVCPGPGFGLKTLSREVFCGNADDRKIGSYSKCYVGFSTNAALRKKASSGGLVTELLLFALEEGLIDGALVTRMSQRNPLESEPFVARNREEMLLASGSKYCPAPTNVALKDIISKNGRYAVVGLPCHIVGVRKYQKLNDALRSRIVLRIGLFCSTSISYSGTRFLLKKCGIAEQDVAEIRYRGDGWPGKGYVRTKSGTTKEVALPEYYTPRFTSFSPSRCRLCNDHTSELADISFGDAWLPEFVNDRSGTSVVITRSRLADHLLERLLRAKRVELSQVGAEKVIKSQGGMNKKVDFKARVNLAQMTGRRVPHYDDARIAAPPTAYVNYCVSLLPRMMAYNPDMWDMIDGYWSLIETMSNARKKVAPVRDF